jgi:serralysin
MSANPYLLQSIGGASVTLQSATHVTFTNTQFGDVWDIYGTFTAFNSAGQPVAGTVTEFDNHGTDQTLGFTATNASFPVTDLLAAPTTANTQAFLTDAFSGNDLITADNAPASNYLAGAAGDDTIDAHTAPQNNTLLGGAGNDSIIGGTGFNQVNGNQGDDTIVGHSKVGDWLLGGQGNDSIDASASTGTNIINGNLGNDTLVGGSGADSLRGGQGDDVIHAGSGNDWISGDLGNNTIYGGQGTDIFHAGAGHDTVNGWHAGDQVQVATGVTFTVTQVAADVHIVFSNGGEMDLLNVQQTSLGSNWIVSA